MKTISRISTFLQCFRQFIYTTFCTTEYNRKIRRFHINQTAKRFEFLSFMNFDVGLFN